MNPLDRAILALDGLTIGDSFGQRFFGEETAVLGRIAERRLPRAPWKMTDDSIMAIGIVETLKAEGAINQDDLARRFAENYKRDPWRGYGGMAHTVLQAIHSGERWQDVAPAVFSGSGSFGNGAAMRVAPLGAFFADDLPTLEQEAVRSAEVTHAHPEGIAGAVAVAAAAAFAFNHRDDEASALGEALLRFVCDITPVGETRNGIAHACRLPLTESIQTAASELGNGAGISSQDTVPFVIWCAARHLDDFETALFETVSGLGDRDTTAAMVGGIVSLRVGYNGIPPTWLESRESLGDWLTDNGSSE